MKKSERKKSPGPDWTFPFLFYSILYYDAICVFFFDKFAFFVFWHFWLPGPGSCDPNRKNSIKKPARELQGMEARGFHEKS